MSLDAKDVEKISHLARLQIDPEKKEAYAKDLSGILDFIAQMGSRALLPQLKPAFTWFPRSLNKQPKTT